MRVRVDIRDHEPGYDIDLAVGAEENTQDTCDEQVDTGETDVQPDRDGNGCSRQLAKKTPGHLSDCHHDHARRPGHSAVLLDPKVRDDPHDTDRVEGERPVVETANRHGHAECQGSDDEDRRQDRRRDPAQRDQVNHADHQRVIEVAGHRHRVTCHDRGGQYHRGVSEGEIEDRQTPGRVRSRHAPSGPPNLYCDPLPVSSSARAPRRMFSRP